MESENIKHLHDTERAQCMRLREFRKYIGLNQAEMASKLKITQQYISLVESCRNPITAQMIYEIRNCFNNLNMDWLLYGEGRLLLLQTQQQQLLEEHAKANSDSTISEKILEELKLQTENLRTELNRAWDLINWQKELINKLMQNSK
ncbi:MAG: XRE family transcriptional regulator [Bacteroidetes bacterium]|nr:MAG: XRE family transcriptional regulator [Bacteroidota bacterium]